MRSCPAKSRSSLGPNPELAWISHQEPAERIQWCLSIDRSGKLKQSASERWARSATVWAMRRDAPCRSMLVWSAGAPLLLLFVQASPISLVADKAHG
jgi:hypothetical protein